MLRTLRTLGTARPTTLVSRARTALPLRPQSTSTSVPLRPCPACSAPIPLAASPCPSCSALVALPSLTHHAILGVSAPAACNCVSVELGALPASGFALDARDLRRRMLERQRALHPDKHGADEGLAKELSGRVNRAYEVLASPLRRAEYILGELGVETLETDSVTDLELLAEIMEAREELEEASGHDEIEAIRDRNHEKVEATTSALHAAFSAQPPDLEHARALVTQLKYWVGLEEAAKNKL
ncbi:molecular chaperone [Cryptotrichosporon argae]